MSPNPPHRNDAILGILCMAGGMFLFSAVDTLGKFLTSNLHPVQIAWSRQLGLVAVVMILLMLHGPRLLHTRHPWLQIGRGALAAGSAVCFIAGVAYVPLADAVAVSFVAPFITTILGALILREYVGIRRWSAIGVGFIGTLLVVRPGMGIVHPAVFLVILAASMFSVRQILSRYLASSDRTSTTVAYTALVSIVLLSIPLPFVWKAPSATEIWLLAGMAIFAAIGESLVIRSLEMAQAVVLAPVHYSLMIWGTIYGYLVFGQIPDLWTWIGAGIIMAGGLYTLHREHLAKS